MLSEGQRTCGGKSVVVAGGELEGAFCLHALGVTSVSISTPTSTTILTIAVAKWDGDYSLFFFLCLPILLCTPGYGLAM